MARTRRRAELIIAIDGPAGSGKSTVAKRLAVELGLGYVDTGAMYRAVGLLVAGASDPVGALAQAGALARDAGLTTSWEPQTMVFRVFAGGREVTAEVRSPAAADWASRVAVVTSVREVLVGLQRDAGACGVVMEGRDIGTVVFPHADFKFFLEADPSERARRRTLDEGRNDSVVARELRARDERDLTRTVAPLLAASDAHRIDTTSRTPEQVVEHLMAHIRGSIAGSD